MNRTTWPLAAGLLTVAALALSLAGCHKQTADDFISAGDSAVQAQKLDEAEGDYKQATDLEPNNAGAHAALANLYILEHKDSAAQAEYMRVLELDPKNAAAHMALGNQYNAQAQYPMAEAQYRAAIAIDPSKANYHADLAAVLAKQGRNAEAETEFRTAIGFDPKDAQAHYQLATLLAATPGHEADAKAEFDSAHQLDPKLVPPAPVTPPTVTAAPAPAGAAAPAEAKIKPVNPPRLFLLTHDSPVYANPDATSGEVGKVRHKKYVKVIGLTKDWLQIKLKDGTIGFIPTSAAE